MPATESTQTPTWSLPWPDTVEIVYTTRDRYTDHLAGLDPNVAYAQRIKGTITGITYDHDRDDPEVRTPLGTLSLVSIDVDEAGDELLEVLDAESEEWINYDRLAIRVMNAQAGDPADGDEDLTMVDSFVIIDRMELVPEARGHGLGLHVLARAIRTWTSQGLALVTLSAWPTDGNVDEDDEEARERRCQGGEALARYWSQLGLERLPKDEDEDSNVPVLWGCTMYEDIGSAIEPLLIWEPRKPVSA
jgi:GNAT superfamily N-acetyltransferase